MGEPSIRTQKEHQIIFVKSLSSLKIMASERYSFSLTTFSPSGKLMQIEYALQAVSSGAASVGLKASNGVVLATEKKTKSILYEEHSTHKIEMITDSIGAVYSGMGPYYRQLVRRAKKWPTNTNLCMANQSLLRKWSNAWPR